MMYRQEADGLTREYDYNNSPKRTGKRNYGVTLGMTSIYFQVIHLL